MKIKYKIFDYCWHIPHQWDMIRALREDCEFFYCLSVFTGWDTSKRPLPPEINFVAASEKEWGFGIPIVHGMDVGDWYDLPKEPRVFTALCPLGSEKYYNRNRMFEVSDILDEQYGYLLQYARMNVDTGDSWDSYRQYLGKSLLYVDTSIRTPMNRARTEAFFSGCCVIQVEGAHDLERWAEDGENMILVPDDPPKIAGVIAELLHTGYQKAIRIGQKGKEMAIKEFSPERYRRDWLTLLQNVTNQSLITK